jgi:hypothetical protein
LQRLLSRPRGEGDSESAPIEAHSEETESNMTKKTAAAKAKELARKAADAASIEEARQHALEAAAHAEEIERQAEFEQAEGERLAREAGEAELTFWQQFKKSVGWE